MLNAKIYRDDLNQIKAAIPNLNNLNGANILITGATGLICSAIVDFLVLLSAEGEITPNIFIASRNETKVLDRFGNPLPENIRYLFYDATQPIKFNIHFDYIIHGAGNANPNLYSTQPVETMTGSILGILNLLNYVKDYECGRVLYISSSEVYGAKNNPEPFDENDFGSIDILNYRACYPSAKRAAETLCASFVKEYGLNVVVSRPGHVYGPTAMPSDNRVSSLFMREASKGQNIILKSSGNQIRSYCYVVDCVSAILTILINGIAGEAYNISNPDSIISIREMAEFCCKYGRVKLVAQKASAEEQNVFNPMDNSSLNSEKLQKLGWKGLFDAETGISHTIQILKEAPNINY